MEPVDRELASHEWLLSLGPLFGDHTDPISHIPFSIQISGVAGYDVSALNFILSVEDPQWGQIAMVIFRLHVLYVCPLNC